MRYGPGRVRIEYLLQLGLKTTLLSVAELVASDRPRLSNDPAENTFLPSTYGQDEGALEKNNYASHQVPSSQFLQVSSYPNCHHPASSQSPINNRWAVGETRGPKKTKVVQHVNRYHSLFYKQFLNARITIMGHLR